MIRAVVIGMYSEDILPMLKEYDIEVISSGKPDVVITYGGDGSLLVAEREYPGIPKLPLRDSRTAPLCPKHRTEDILKSYAEGRMKSSEMLKISALFKGIELIALNDIFVHNCERVTAIRYSVDIDGDRYIRETASDSFGVVTPHGSTAYFKSITGTIFRVGIGMAFSNTREREDHIIVDDNSKIDVTIIRGPAIMVADNSSRIIKLNDGDKIEFRKYEKTAQVYGLREFMCMECRKLRHKRCG